MFATSEGISSPKLKFLAKVLIAISAVNYVSFVGAAGRLGGDTT